MAKKRANGEGSLRRRPNGRWEWTFMEGYQSNGKRRIKSFYGRSLTEVKQKAQPYLEARAKGINMGADYGFSEWADL